MNPLELVRVDDSRFPDLEDFAWSALLQTLPTSIPDMEPEILARWENMILGDIERVVSVEQLGTDKVLWVWHHNGAGDFVRISASQGQARWMVVFNHESERSPYGLDAPNSKGLLLPEGLEWIDDYHIKRLIDSDIQDGDPRFPEVPAITEAYRRSTFSVTPNKQGLYQGDPYWESSSLIEQMNQNFVREDDYYDEPKQSAMRAKLKAGHRPTLSELIEYTESDLAAAAAFLKIRQIDKWLEEKQGF